MVFGYVYEKGRRKNNQDALLIRCSKFSKGELIMAVICDGMGGEEYGELASYECVRFLDLFYDKELISIFQTNGRSERKRRKMIESKVVHCFHEINESLFQMMRQKKGRLGTTASVLILFQNKYYLFHIGDSRVYFLNTRSGFISQTKDHTKEYKLTRCLGLNRDFKPDFQYGYCFHKQFLLCTDGFWHKYNSDVWKACLDIGAFSEIKGAVNERSLGEIERMEAFMSKRLRELAMDNFRKGENDNCSAIWIKK